MSYRLSRKAEDDILRIYLESTRLFGRALAETYHQNLKTTIEHLAARPRMARERTEISPPVRIHPFKAHLIVYVIEDTGGIFIIRVRHGHEDWTATE